MRRARRFGLHGQDGATSRQSEAAKGGIFVGPLGQRPIQRFAPTIRNVPSTAAVCGEGRICVPSLFQNYMKRATHHRYLHFWLKLFQPIRHQPERLQHHSVGECA
jgi:hypothetical protein